MPIIVGWRESDVRGEDWDLGGKRLWVVGMRALVEERNREWEEECHFTKVLASEFTSCSILNELGLPTVQNLLVQFLRVYISSLVTFP